MSYPLRTTRPDGTVRIRNYRTCPGCNRPRRTTKHFRQGSTRCDRCLRFAARSAVAAIATAGGAR